MDYAARVDGHALWQTLDSLEATLESRNDANDDDARLRFDRIALVARHVRGRVQATDPRLVTLSAMTAMNQQFAAAVGHLGKFLADRNPGHLNAMDNQIDAALHQLATIQTYENLEDVESLGEIITSFRRSVGQQRAAETKTSETLQSEIAAISQDANQVQSTLDTQKARVDEFITASQKQITESEQARAANFQTTLNDLSARFREREKALEAEYRALAEERAEAAVGQLNSVTTDLRKKTEAFEAAEKERVDRYDLALQELDGAREENEDLVNDRLELLEAGSQEEIAALTKYAAEAKRVVDGHAEQAEKVVQLISSSAMSDQYSNVAAREGDYARKWSIAAIALLVGLVGFAIYTFLPGEGKPAITLAGALGRLGITLAFGFAATYAARQSGTHREAEIRATRLQLEFAALEPYLASLSDEERNAVKTELATRLFGNEVGPGVDPWQGVSPPKLLEQMVQALRKG